MKNADIRTFAASKGVKMWQIANALGINDGNFSRKLRQELPQELKDRIFTIIEKISNGEDVSHDHNYVEEKSNPSPEGGCAIIASRIKGLLNQCGMTQTDLGKRTSILQNTISCFCNGSRIPNAIHIIKIADAFNVSADYILGRSNVLQKDIDAKQIQSRLDKIINCINEVMGD